jgi:hypothetical protein
MITGVHRANYLQADAATIHKIQAASIKYALQDAVLGNRLALMVSVQSSCSLSDDKRQVLKKKLLNGRVSLRQAKQLLIAGWVETLTVGIPIMQARAIEMAMKEFGIGKRAIERALKALKKIRTTAVPSDNRLSRR